MAHEVSRRPLEVVTQVRARVSRGGKSGTGWMFSPSSSVLPISINPPWFLILIHRLGGGQLAPWWPHFTDVVSYNRHEKHEQK
jgi:hypothetical protein